MIRCLVPDVTLYQGNIQDLNKLKPRYVKDPDFGRIKVTHPFTLVVNVGSTNWLPPDTYAVHFPMVDGPPTGPNNPSVKENDWDRVYDLAIHIVSELLGGGTVLVTCDVGVSRSVTLCGMVLAILRDVPMDENLLATIRSPIARPSEELWKAASKRCNASIVQR